MTGSGKPNGKTMRVEAGDDLRPIAETLKRSTIQQQSDFNRAIHDAPSRVAQAGAPPPQLGENDGGEQGMKQKQPL